MPDLVTHDDARPVLSAAHLEGHITVGANIFTRENSESAGEIYIDTALLPATSGSTGSPKTARPAGLYSDAEPRRPVPAMADGR
jgi:long-subunit acyl-CoA synthetase (AMP-forming)